MDALETTLQAISEKKGENIIVYDVVPVSSITDTMVIATSQNLRQNQAIVQNIKDRLYENGYEGPFKIEGNEHSNWVLVDLGDIVVHVFTRDERMNYSLDRLYDECVKRYFV